MRSSASVLAAAFFSEAATAFEPLLTDAETQWSCTLRHATPKGLEFTTPDQIRGFFLADCEFQTSDVIGDITFGDREYLINTVVSQFGRPHRYGLWEWADALDRPDLVPRATDFVFQLDRLREIVRGMADGLAALRLDIARATPATLERMELARMKVQAALEEQWRRAEHEGIVARANEAFRQQRWDRAITLLESITGGLTVAEAERLAYARKSVRRAPRRSV